MVMNHESQRETVRSVNGSQRRNPAQQKIHKIDVGWFS